MCSAHASGDRDVGFDVIAAPYWKATRMRRSQIK
jgi:hypothetical protein